MYGLHIVYIRCLCDNNLQNSTIVTLPEIRLPSGAWSETWSIWCALVYSENALLNRSTLLLCYRQTQWHLIFNWLGMKKYYYKLAGFFITLLYFWLGAKKRTIMIKQQLCITMTYFINRKIENFSIAYKIENLVDARLKPRSCTS